MRASAVVKIMRGNSSSSSSAAAALLAMMVMMMTIFITKTNCFSINQTITISSTWCDGRNDDPSCFIGETDLDSDEFMLDSEFSRRILGGTDNHISGKANNPNQSVQCGRKGMPPCHDNKANQKTCPEATNRNCYRTP